MKAPAAERNASQAGIAPARDCPLRERLRERGVKRGGRVRDRRCVGPVRVRHSRKQRQEIEPPLAIDGIGVLERLDRAVAGSQLLEPHRRLAFEGLHLADPKQARGRIEHAARAARRRAVQVRGEHACERDAARSRVALLDLPTTPERVQDGYGHAPGFARRAIAPRQRKRAQMSETGAAGTLDLQELSAPGRAIGAETDPVERDADHRALDTVLGDDGRDVRVMVLHADRRQAAPRGEIDREARIVKIGMQIVCHRLRRDPQHRQHGVHRVLERAAGRRIGEVADVVRDEGRVAVGDTYRVLEPGTDGEDRRRIARQSKCVSRRKLRRANGLRDGVHGAIASVCAPGVFAASSASPAVARTARAPAASHATQASIPSPVVADVRSTWMSGLTRRA